MTVGAQRQAHAPSQVAHVGPTAEHEARIEAVLTAPSREMERLDFTAEFTELNDAVRAVVGFAGAAALIGEDTFEARLTEADRPGFYTFEVSHERIERLRWAIEYFEHIAKRAQDAADSLETLVCWEGIEAPVVRRLKREAGQ